MGSTCRATVYVERYAKLFKRVLNQCVITVHHLLNTDALLAGTYSYRNTMLIASTDKKHRPALEAQIAYIDVGWHIHSCQMTNVYRAVGIRQCRSHCSSFELLVH